MAEIMRGPKVDNLTLGGIGPDLPDPGKDRFWRIELVKGVDRNPIKVTLMEVHRPGGKLFSPLAHARTNAIPAKVYETAETILSNVSDYATIIGDYSKEA